MAKDVVRGDDLPESPERRRLFIGACAGASAVIGGALGAVSLRVLLSPLTAKALQGEAARLDIGPVAEMEGTKSGTSGPREIVVERAIEDGFAVRKVKERVLVVRDAKAASGLAVLSATCSHLGCGVSWNDSRHAFVCPCHGGVYAEDGTVVSGPPPKPLTRLPFVVEGGRVALDLTKLA